MPKANNVIPFPVPRQQAFLRDLAPQVDAALAAMEIFGLDDAELATIAGEHTISDLYHAVTDLEQAERIFTVMAARCATAATRLSRMEGAA